MRRGVATARTSSRSTRMHMLVVASKVMSHAVCFWKELARRLSHVSTVVIAQMDCTRNDLGPLWGCPVWHCPKVALLCLARILSQGSVSGFPTIALFPSGDTSGMIEFYASRPDESGSCQHRREHAMAKVGSRKPDDMIRWLHTKAAVLTRMFHCNYRW